MSGINVDLLCRNERSRCLAGLVPYFQSLGCTAQPCFSLLNHFYAAALQFINLW